MRVADGKQRLQQPAHNHEDQCRQKHQHGYLVDAVHHAQVEIGAVVGVFAAEPIRKDRAEVEYFPETTHGIK